MTRVRDPRADYRVQFRRIRQWSLIAAAMGAIALAFFASKAVREAGAPRAPLPAMDHARLADPATPLPSGVRLTGVSADRSRSWTHRYRVRGRIHEAHYYALVPRGGATADPIALVELARTSAQYGAARWNMIDPPGPREGVPTLLDGWTAARLRDAGLVLAPRVVVLERRPLDGRDPEPDPLDDALYAIFAFTASFCGSLSWWLVVRAERKIAAAER